MKCKYFPLALAVVLGAQTGLAATRTVTTLTDETDGGNGFISLREAIAASAVNDTINFAVTGTITLTNELMIVTNLTISGPDATKLTVSGNHASRVFNILAGTVSLSNLTISQGYVAGTNGAAGNVSHPDGFPGGDIQGGGILNRGTLTLLNCTLSGNVATGGNGGPRNDSTGGGGDGGSGSGGGICNHGTLSLANCTLSTNSATGGDGGTGDLYIAGVGGSGSGGGIYNQGTLNLANCILSANSATGGYGGRNRPLDYGSGGGSGNGGGVYNQGTMSVTNCILSTNSATGGYGTFAGDGSGGGIYNQGTLNLANCTLSANSAIGSYGGLVYDEGYSGGNGSGGGICTQGTLNLANCTLSANSARGGDGASYGWNPGHMGGSAGWGGMAEGGSIHNLGGIAATNCILMNCTVSGNSAIGGDGGDAHVAGSGGNAKGGGISQVSAFSTKVGSSILAGNSATGGAAGYGMWYGTNGGSLAPDVSLLVASDGYNLIGRTDASSAGSWGARDLIGTVATPLNPVLGPLQDNGGPTFTHALLTGSPAIDKGAAFGSATDQRGRLRPYNFAGIANAADGSDIGAFEFQPDDPVWQPVLRIARLANKVVLSWSTNGSGFTLEANTDVASSVTWSNMPGTPTVVGDQLTITNLSTTGVEFYRLRSP